MFNTSSILANVYSSFSPTLNLASAVCTINGNIVPCGQWGALPLALLMVWLFMVLVVSVLVIAGTWKMFKKAGKPGWAAIVPIYNYIIMLEIIHKPLWWIFLFLIPFVNIIFGFILAYHIAKVFGKGFGFTIGLIFLPFIFYPILGFGKAIYTASQESQQVSV